MVSQGVGGHEGYSGTPLWKIQQTRDQRDLLQESLSYAMQRKPIVSPNVLVEAVSLGGPPGKPFARHVLVKCLRKVADRSRIELPSTGLFHNQAPMGLFALFDGQSCAGEPGPGAADYAARNFHKKVLDNLASLPPGFTNEKFVKAALVKSFEDLDADLLKSQPEVQDGCGAAVLLLVGEHLFTAVLGACDALLCEAQEGGSAGSSGSGGSNLALQPVSLGRNQGRCSIPDERARLVRNGGVVVGEGTETQAVGAAGGRSSVSRSLGDPSWKQPGGTVLTCIPEIQSVKLGWAEQHICILLATKPLLDAVNSHEMAGIAAEFVAQPRAACGEIVTTAADKAADSSQCTAVEVWLLPGGPGGEGFSVASEEGRDVAGGSANAANTARAASEAPKKKAKQNPSTLPGSDMKSARLRHILVKFQDAQRPAVVDANGKKVTRSRHDAEALMRRLLRELREQLYTDGGVGASSKRNSLPMLKSETFQRLCKEHSECPTSQKGGGMCGDLGWVSPDAQAKLGRDFQSAVSVLRPGNWSDIVASSDGLHIIQRIA